MKNLCDKDPFVLEKIKDDIANEINKLGNISGDEIVANDYIFNVIDNIVKSYGGNEPHVDIVIDAKTKERAIKVFNFDEAKNVVYLRIE